MSCARPLQNFFIIFAVLLSAAMAQQNVHSLKPESIPGLSFLPPATYGTGGTEAVFVAVADFNHDGIPDLAVANAYFVNTIGILLGNGDGTFQSAKSYRTSGGYANTIVPVDLDGDGNLDLVVSNQSRCYVCLQEASISVFKGNGDGTFQLTHVYDAGGLGFSNNGFGPAEMAVADLNGDGHVDIVVLNCAAKRSSGNRDGVISVLFGNGDGSFQTAVSNNPGIPLPGTGLALADLDGDGKLDLVVTAHPCTLSTECPLGRVTVLMGNGDGTFRPTAHYDSGTWGVTGVVVADVNHDGKPDVIVGGCGGTSCWDFDGIVSVLLGNGDGTFQAAVSYDSGGALADSIAVADVDGDGNLDIVVANVISASVGVLLGNGDGTFARPVTLPAGPSFIYSVAVEDLNGDGKPDILSTSCSTGVECGGTNPGGVEVFLNAGGSKEEYSSAQTGSFTPKQELAP
jgi:FG-GAP-like repeat